MTPPVVALERYRQHRAFGVALSVVLVLLVGLERRLAEAHFNFAKAVPAIESNDALDGDELRVRLIVLNDDKPPTLPDTSIALKLDRMTVIEQRYASLAPGRPAPRGPPSRAAAWKHSFA